jgi:hypothetical protein
MRRAVIERLRASPDVFAIVGDRVHSEPPQNVTWPFIRYGLPLTAAFEASCWEGSEHDLTVHVFAKGDGGEDVCENLAAAVVTALDDFELANVDLIGIEWINTQVVRDTEEASAYHGIIRFTATTAEPV